ncbi:conserved exported hypothetical protein [Candidatus Sulfopaludibacter sp. SbA4]|nr:conserved exported hypothetical protein [Candidatus Sulfopaludibacter sp. SbA4]
MASSKLALVAQAFLPVFLYAQIYASNLPADHPAIHYMQGAVDDPVAQLINRRVKLEPREGFGYLPSLLEHLGINPDSQALVFSKTSFQAEKISPRNPRAIYFTDDAAVGWVRGSDSLEVAATDPQRGTVFYTLNAADGQPRFTRQDVCLKCHQGPATLGVPGIFVGSVFPSSSGMPDRLGAIITDHRTALEDRWGGWYVTAAHGEQRDRANAVAPDPAEPHALRTEGKQNLTSLVREFNTTGYLMPSSDIVALMTFEHQTQMTNFITRLAWEARMGQSLDADIDAIVAYMLFAEEAPLREPIEGVSTFAKTFPQRGPRDSHGRSLRDFDLHTRLFRYPLSYMVHSAAFEALPEGVRGQIWRRVYDVLEGRNPSPKFARLTAEDRRAILEILRDTR